MTRDIGLLAAAMLGCAGYAAYLFELYRKRTLPDRASWLIWTAFALILGLMRLDRGTWEAWAGLMSVPACLLVTLAAWHRSRRMALTTIEAAPIATCLSSLLLSVARPEAAWAHALLIAAVPVSFWPSWASVRRHPDRRQPFAWALWSIGGGVALIATAPGRHGIVEIAFPIVTLACIASVWAASTTTAPALSRRFGRAPGSMLGRDRATRDRLTLRDHPHGQTVHAACRIAEGAELMRFPARRFLRSSRTMPNEYIGPSGKLAALVNHSCAPNAGLRFTDDGAILVAIRDLACGDEISWDCSTTIAYANWHMICQCRSDACRRVIGNFQTLDPVRQEYFRARNLVAPELRRRDGVVPVRRAS